MSTANANTSAISDSVYDTYPELRIHLAHLRALHHQRSSGRGGVLPKLKNAAVPVNELIPVRVHLTPEVVDVFRATGTGWKGRINEVLLALVGKPEGK